MKIVPKWQLVISFLPLLILNVIYGAVEYACEFARAVKEEWRRTTWEKSN